MIKKTIIAAFDSIALKLKDLVKENESDRRKLEVTAEELKTKAAVLAETAKDKENIRRKLEVTAEEKEVVRKKLVITAQNLKKLSATLEKQVIQRTTDLEHREKDFISMSSHQLLTPLALIKGYISMLISGKLGKIDGEAKKYLEESLQAGERMSNLIKSLLETSRVESENLKIVTTTFDIDQLVRHVSGVLKPKLEGKQLTLILPTPKQLLVFADPSQTTEVLMNVIDNAIKYTDKGTITITEGQQDGMAIVAIQDTGIGISQTDLPHIFDKFYASANWLKKQGESHGLGLYIAQLLLTYMGGSIKVESKIKKGSTFFIRLPLAKND